MNETTIPSTQSAGPKLNRNDAIDRCDWTPWRRSGCNLKQAMVLPQALGARCAVSVAAKQFGSYGDEGLLWRRHLVIERELLRSMVPT